MRRATPSSSSTSPSPAGKLDLAKPRSVTTPAARPLTPTRATPIKDWVATAGSKVAKGWRGLTETIDATVEQLKAAQLERLKERVRAGASALYTTRVKAKLTPDRRMPWSVRVLVHDVVNSMWWVVT